MFSKYKYVHMLWQERSFTRAAEKLFISQPSLSAAIRGIEEQVGAPLFQRTGSGVVPTDVGQVYVDAVEQIIRIEAECVRRIDDIGNLTTGSLTVGGTNYLSSFVFPRILNAFSRQYPGIRVENVEAHSDRLEEMMKNDEVDLVIDSFDSTGEGLYRLHPLVRERVLLCVPSGLEVNRGLEAYAIHPEDLYRGTVELDRVPPVSIREFRDQDFIALKKGNNMHARAVEIFRRGGITPRIRFLVDQLNIACSMVELGTGLCFATDTVFRYGKFSNDVTLYQIGEDDGSRTLCIALRKGKYCSRVMEQFTRTAREVIRPIGK